MTDRRLQSQMNLNSQQHSSQTPDQSVYAREDRENKCTPTNSIKSIRIVNRSHSKIQAERLSTKSSQAYIKQVSQLVITRDTSPFDGGQAYSEEEDQEQDSPYLMLSPVVQQSYQNSLICSLESSMNQYSFRKPDTEERVRRVLKKLSLYVGEEKLINKPRESAIRRSGINQLMRP